MPDAITPSDLPPPAAPPPPVTDARGRVVRSWDGRGAVTWTAYGGDGPAGADGPDDPVIVGD